jgi:nitroimidazol reductase NimA-like FMN-containing flavoprotein (pyridoxamine 5'-phosphate oxidase superfamily)
MPMAPEEVDEFLAAPRLCHFATVDSKGWPRVRPTWYLWRDGAFYFTTRLRARHFGRHVLAGSPVSISVGSEDRPYRAVVASGRAEELGKDQDLMWAISSRYGEPEAREWLAEAMTESDRTTLKLVPEKLESWDYGKDN